MAEVGVLNLEVNANTSSAGKKLDDLVGALKRVKEAIAGGLNLSSIAKGIERLGQVVNEQMSDPTIAKIGKLSDALGKLKSEGNVNIVIHSDSISKMNDAVENSKDSFREAENAASTFGDEFDDSLEVTESRLELLRDKLSILKDELQKGIDKDSFDDKKVINYKLQILGLEKEIDNLTEAQERANNADYYQDLTTTFSTIDLYKMKYSALYDKLMKNVESGSWGEDKIASAMLQLEKLHDKIFSLREEMNGGEGLRILDQNQKDELFELADGYLQANDEASRLKTQISALKEELGNGIKYGTMTETQLTKLADKIARYESKLSKLAPVMEEVAQNAQEFNDALESVEPAVDAASETAEATKEVIASNTEEEMEYLRELEKRIADVKEEAAESEALRKEQEEKFYEPPETYSFDQTNAMADNLTQLDLLKAQLVEAEQKYNDLVNSLGAGSVKTIKAGLAVSDLRDKIWQYEQELENAKNAPAPEYFDMAQTNAMVDNITQLDLLQAKLTESEIQYNQFVNELGASNSKTIQAGLAVANLREKIAQYTENMEKAKDATKEAGEETRKTKGIFETFKGTLQGLFPHLDKLRKKFIQVAINRSIRAVLRQITEGLKEGVENVYYYSKAIGSSFAPSMDAAASSLLQMKNSLGAAIAPLIQSLIPVLQTVVNWFITAVNYVNQFFALLRGQATWTRALPATTTAFGKQEKAAKGAAAAVKDLLADWDELNIIQSETSGAGAGAGTSAAEDYLNMFEEVSTFDSDMKNVVKFLQDNFDDILNVAKDIGLAVLAWRLSDTFLSGLTSLSSIVKIGVVLKLAYDSAELFDDAYVASGNAAALIANGVMSGALAAIAGVLANAAFGTGAGLITAGLTLSVSAAADFKKSSSLVGTVNDSKKNMLNLLGFVKLGISSALATAGFITLGVNPVLSMAGGVIAMSLITAITYGIQIEAENAESAKQAAQRAFAQTGEGGINPQDYINALQEEFDAQTAGAHLVLNAFVDVPDLKSKLFSAAMKISAFNQIIFHGNGKLTEEDAKEFESNWTIILDTLKELNTKRYDTILEGLTQALNSKSAELRTSAEEIRTTFIMLEQNISAENAEIYKSLQDLTLKIRNGDTSEETLNEYEKYYRVFAAATRSGLDEVDKAIKQGENIDFGDADHAVENAKNFVQTVSASADEAIKAEDDALSAIIESVEGLRRVENEKANQGIITQDELKERMSAFDEIIKVATDYANEKKGEISGKAQEAWNKVFEQALGAETLTDAYWETVLVPLMKEAKEAGYKIPESVGKAFAEGVGSVESVQEFYKDPAKYVKELQDKSASEIVKALQEDVENEFNVGQENGVWNFLTGFLYNHNNTGLTPVQMQAKDLLGITGWDYWSQGVKDAFMTALRNAVGDVKAGEVAEKLGYEWTVEGDVNNTVKENTSEPTAPVVAAAENARAISADARILMDYVLNALNSGKGLGEITAATQQGITDKGPEAWVEVQDIVNEIVSAYREMEKNGFVDTEALMRKYSQYGTAGVPSGEQVHLDEGDLSSGVQAGTERANAEQNTILREIERVLRLINNKPNTVVYAPNTTAARVNKQSDVMFANVTGDV